MRRLRKARVEETEHADRWLVSYADFITLLFAFFTALYAISHVDMGKLRMFTGSMRTAFHGTGAAPQTPVIEGIVPVLPDVLGIEKQMKAALTAVASDDEVRVVRDGRGVVVSIGEQLLFPSGETTLVPHAAAVLSAVASVIRRVPFDVVIEGHTDAMAAGGGRNGFSSNWELSAGRANRVVAAMITDYGFPPEKFSSAAYAEFRPVASNLTPEGRAKNRRVEIVVKTGAADGSAGGKGGVHD